MSGISVKNYRLQPSRLDGRVISKVQFIGVGSVAIDMITKSLGFSKSNQVHEVKSIKLSDHAGQAISKWTEEYSIYSGKTELWTKLEGITSPSTPREINLISGIQHAQNTFDDAGVFIPNAPNQTDDSGEASKIEATGTGYTKIDLFSEIESYDIINLASYFALWPSGGKHIYLAPNGDIYVAICVNFNGSVYSRAIYGKSTNGGISWVWTELHAHEDSQSSLSMAADKYGDIHFVWKEHDIDDDFDDFIRHKKLTIATNTLSAMGTINTYDGVGTTCNDDCVVHANRAGNIEVIWMGVGYGDSPTYLNLLLRPINADGTYGAIVEITSDGSADLSYMWINTLDYDSYGHRHIIYSAVTYVDDLDVFNLYYIQETFDGFQAPILINDDAGDVGLLYMASNILVNKANDVVIAYEIANVDATVSLYMKKIVNGVLGARVTIKASCGGAFSQIQVDDKNQIVLVHADNTDVPSTYNYHIVSPDISVIGPANLLYTAPAGKYLNFVHIPWSISPDLNGINPNVPQQGMIMIGIDAHPDAWTVDNTIDVKIHFMGNCILGVPILPPRLCTYSYNIRGSISRTKFNNLANSVIA